MCPTRISRFDSYFMLVWSLVLNYVHSRCFFEDMKLGSVVYPRRLCSSKLDDSNADDLVLVKKGAISANIVFKDVK